MKKQISYNLEWNVDSIDTLPLVKPKDKLSKSVGYFQYISVGFLKL